MIPLCNSHSLRSCSFFLCCGCDYCLRAAAFPCPCLCPCLCLDLYRGPHFHLCDPGHCIHSDLDLDLYPCPGLYLGLLRLWSRGPSRCPPYSHPGRFHCRIDLCPVAFCISYQGDISLLLISSTVVPKNYADVLAWEPICFWGSLMSSFVA